MKAQVEGDGIAWRQRMRQRNLHHGFIVCVRVVGSHESHRRREVPISVRIDLRDGDAAQLLGWIVGGPVSSYAALIVLFACEGRLRLKRVQIHVPRKHAQRDAGQVLIGERLARVERLLVHVQFRVDRIVDDPRRERLSLRRIGRKAGLRSNALCRHRLRGKQEQTRHIYGILCG